MATPFKTHTVTLATSGAASSAIPLEGYSPFAIQMSSAFTGTKLHFEGSLDESTYQVMEISSDGSELQATVAANKYVVFTNPEYFLGLKSLKIRPGVSSAPSTQAAARTIKLLTRAL